ncbi:sigma-54 dependent transcriptional regulator [uncultured Thiodictyon sp.]|jgi:two-component system nitrogen regulation response regulator GlnG|uniref:sigma-54-dependent transcriptional regulator n=1 Tax=uncultured Thiodictyon sp. TaxID=1846217 RepID=UPI0025EE9307|nr:sigma-54 dependent transcriptional regulator [uncultured Thiodictyon sp.]
MNGEMSESSDVILVVDDDESMRRILQLVLQRAGFRVIAAQDAGEGLCLARTCGPRLAILDYRLPDMTGLDLLRRLKVASPHLPVILLTGFADLAGAVVAIKEGAFDYLSKPFDNQGLLNKVREALACRQQAPMIPSAALGLRARMGTSPAITRTIEDVERVAPTNFAVSLFGETGAGKEVVARAIHDLSPRAGHPFVAVDCGTIPDTLIENELFGHERGAFTGAERQQPGKFEAAHGGTLLLDEIGNLAWSAQARLLRVLQERVIYRVGGTKPVPVDVRLISASNQDLTEAVSKGTFREDLLYRLCDYRVAVPPLRARAQDILHIATQFLAEANRELGKQVGSFTEEAAAALLAYPWPGNVRQLRSIVRRAVLIANFTIDTHHLALPDAGPERTPTAADNVVYQTGLSLKEIVRTRMADVERQVLFEALQRSRGNKAAVARMLQVDYKTVHTKLKTYGLSA